MGWGPGTDRASAAGRVRACTLKGMNLSACTELVDAFHSKGTRGASLKGCDVKHALLHATNYCDWLG